MRGNGKVFISHAHDDNERCGSLLAALDAWGVDYWFDTQQMGAGDNLSLTIQRAIATAMSPRSPPCPTAPKSVPTTWRCAWRCAARER